MSEDVVDAETGEIVDVSKLSDRQLMEAVFAKQAAIEQALLNVLDAVGGVQTTTQAVLDGISGHAKSKEGQSLEESVDGFKKAIGDLVGAVQEVPDKTADKVDGRFEKTMIRVVGGTG